jgi:hypothetical protein
MFRGRVRNSRVPRRNHTLRHIVRKHRHGCSSLRRMLASVCCWTGMFCGCVHCDLSDGRDRVRDGLRQRHDRPDKLWRLWACMRFRTSLCRWSVHNNNRMSDRNHTLRNGVCQRNKRPGELRGLRSDVFPRSDLYGRDLLNNHHLPDGHHDVRNIVCEHHHGFSQLRRMWAGM